MNDLLSTTVHGSLLLVSMKIEKKSIASINCGVRRREAAHGVRANGIKRRGEGVASD